MYHVTVRGIRGATTPPCFLPSWSSSRSSPSPSLTVCLGTRDPSTPNIGPNKRALTNQSYNTSITSSGYALGNASVIWRPPPRARAIVLFVKNSMPLFAKVLVVTENENKKHAALKRRAGQRNWKRLPWNSTSMWRQTKLGRVFPMCETVGDENVNTG